MSTDGGPSAFPPHSPQPPPAPASALRETLVPPSGLGSPTVTPQARKSAPHRSKPLLRAQQCRTSLLLGVMGPRLQNAEETIKTK